MTATSTPVVPTGPRMGETLIQKRDQERVFHAEEVGPSLRLENEDRMENEDFFDTEAFDILQKLSCATLLDSHTSVWRTGGQVYGESTQVADGNRRLEEQQAQEKGYDVHDDRMDDDFMGSEAYVTAAHLFCQAATQNDVEFWREKLQCSASPQDLIDLWSDARSEFVETQQLLHLLGLVVEQSIDLGDDTYHIWAPLNDDGTNFMVDSINAQFRDNARNANLEENLGEGRLYVDVGSGLGYTALAIAQLYPDTDIVSIERKLLLALCSRHDLNCTRLTAAL